MSSDFFKMAAQPPMMSTPIKGKYSSLFQDIALLPYRLFGRCSGDKSNTLNMDSPTSRSPIPPSVNMSPCRHSLRLLSNGYYIYDEDSLCWDDVGNISFSPTQCSVSYKENMVRIFRRRRKALAQRRLDLTNYGHNGDRNLSDYEDLNDMNDIEPLVVEQIYHSSSENLGLCNSGNSNLYPPTLLNLEDSEHVPSGYSHLVNDGHSSQCCPEKSPMELLHDANSYKQPQPEHDPANPVLPGSPQNVNNEVAEPLLSMEHFPFVKDKGDGQIGRCSYSGYLLVKKEANACYFSYDITNLRAPKRRLTKKRPSDSMAITLTPSIKRASMDVDDTRQSGMIPLAIAFIPLLLLCLIFWWVRSPDHHADSD